MSRLTQFALASLLGLAVTSGPALGQGGLVRPAAPPPPPPPPPRFNTQTWVSPAARTPPPLFRSTTPSGGARPSVPSFNPSRPTGTSQRPAPANGSQPGRRSGSSTYRGPAGGAPSRPAFQPRAEQTRQHIETVVRQTLQGRGREMVVTSRYRADSPAHRRGAIDIRSNNIPSAQRRAEAVAISRNLGRGYTVVVEEVNRGRGTQTNTSYRNGQLLNQHRNQPITATATHTHIQPDRR